LIKVIKTSPAASLSKRLFWLKDYQHCFIFKIKFVMKVLEAALLKDDSGEGKQVHLN